MTSRRTSGRQAAAIVLLLAGALAVLGSAGAWATCSTTGCNGFLQAFSERSGLEFGHGYVTGVAGSIWRWSDSLKGAAGG